MNTKRPRLAIVLFSNGLSTVFRIHLFTLLFEECKLMCAKIVDEVGVVFNMIRLLSFACKTLQRQTDEEGAPTAPPPSVTPKWMTPMLLFIDLHEKVVLGPNRRAALSKVRRFAILKCQILANNSNTLRY